MKNYIAYIRVSTVRQGTHGVSLEEQRRAIENYATQHQISVAQWFEERETAARTGRPVFGQVLKLLKDRKADGLLIHALDRGARNLWDWASLGDLIDEGIDVQFVREGVNLNSRGGRLAADIQAVVAADYVRNLREETLKGFYGRLKQGYYPLKAPLGYRDNGSGRLKTVCPTAGPLVKMAFARYARGDLTLAMLSRYMYALGLKNRTGGNLSENGVSAILNNPFYVGLVRVKRSGEIFVGKHEPLISKSLFDRVQDVLHGRTQKRIRKHDFLYRGLLRCTQCNHHLIGEWQRGRVYYRCHQKHDSPVCLSEDAVEEMIQHELTAMAPSDLRKLLDGSRRDKRAREEELALVRSRLDKLKQRLVRLDELYRDGLLERELYWSRKNAYLAEQLEIEERSRCVEGRVRSYAQICESILLKAADFTKLSPNEKRQVAKALFVERPLHMSRLDLCRVAGSIDLSSEPWGFTR